MTIEELGLGGVLFQDFIRNTVGNVRHFGRQDLCIFHGTVRRVLISAMIPNMHGLFHEVLVDGLCYMDVMWMDIECPDGTSSLPERWLETPSSRLGIDLPRSRLPYYSFSLIDQWLRPLFLKPFLVSTIISMRQFCTFPKRERHHGITFSVSSRAEMISSWVPHRVVVMVNSGLTSDECRWGRGESSNEGF